MIYNKMAIDIFGITLSQGAGHPADRIMEGNWLLLKNNKKMTL